MVVADNKGNYILDYSVEGGGIFSVTKPKIEVKTIAEKQWAKAFPQTPMLFDMLELLNSSYPNCGWHVE